MSIFIILGKIIGVILSIKSAVEFFVALPDWINAACMILKIINCCLKCYERRKLSRPEDPTEKPVVTTESSVKD